MKIRRSNFTPLYSSWPKQIVISKIIGTCLVANSVHFSAIALFNCVELSCLKRKTETKKLGILILNILSVPRLGTVLIQILFLTGISSHQITLSARKCFRLLWNRKVQDVSATWKTQLVESRRSLDKNSYKY